MTRRVYLAADLGASSGRVMAGLFDGKRLALREVHRFPNAAVDLAGHLHWNALGLFVEIKRGLSLAAQQFGAELCSMGIDTWGVDYGWLDAGGRLLGLPYAYRDARTEGMMEKAFSRVPRRDIYEATGIQFMPFNTLYQVLCEQLTQDPRATKADRLLFMPDLLNYWLTGCKVNERTIASTSQMLDPRTGRWHEDLLRRLGLPGEVLGELIEPGTVLGNLRNSIHAETGLAGPLPVVAPGCHDTASAVGAVPARGDGHAYLSSGTWSLMGIESDAPVINDRTYAHDLTNEGGVGGKIRLLKNIAGLWLIQECRREWAARGEEHDFEELCAMAETAPPFGPLFDPDDPGLIAPGDMPARIADACEQSGGEPPCGKPAIVRAALESLALKYRQVFGMLEELAGGKLDTLHVVGGGARNRLLNRFTASALNRPVVAGPFEATSAGNILLQMLALGDLNSIQEGRALIAKSFPVQTYEPEDPSRWEEVYAARFKNKTSS